MSRKIALDLSKFKHVKSDKDTTTLQHKDGHQLTIAHGKLTKDFQKQLSALSAMAGKSSDRGEAVEDQQQGMSNTPASEAPSRKMYASGGDISGMSKDVNSDKGVWDTLKDKASSAATNLQSAMSSPSSPAPNTTATNGHYKSAATGDEYAQGGQVQRFAEGTENAPVGMPTELPEKAPMMTQNPDITPKAQANMAEAKLDALPSKAPQDTGMQAQKDMYNMMVAQGGGSREDMFGENGEPPKNPVNPESWNAVKNSPDTEKLGAFNTMQIGRDWKNQTQMQEHQKAVAQNQVNSELGIPNTPDPGTPAPSPEQPQPPVGDKLVQPQAQQPDPYDAFGMMQQGYQNQIAGIKGQADAQVGLAQQQAELYKQQQAIQQQTQDHYQNSYQTLDKERQALVADVKNGYIDPDKYWTGEKDPITGETHGGHSKLMAGIGILLGGFNNRADGRNAALDNIHYQMDQNINAQAKNLQAKDNLLGHNIQQFGNLKDGVMMTRIMQNDMLVSKLQEAAAKSASPQAKAAAQQAIGQIQATNAPLFQQFAMRRAMMSLANNSQTQPGAVEHMLGMLRVMNPEMAKEMEGRMVPGLGPNGSAGMATIPVPPEVRTKLVGFQNIDNLSKDLLQFSKHNSTIMPGTPQYNVGAQKALLLQSAIREGQLGTVYKEGEQPLLDKFVNSNPAGAMKMLTTVPQLKALLQTNQMQANSLKKNYGLPISQGPAVVDSTQGAQQSQALQWAKANPKDPRAAKILNLLGK